MARVARKVERDEWLGYLLVVGRINYEHRRLVHSIRIDREYVSPNISLVVVDLPTRLGCPSHVAVNARGCTVVIIVGHLVGMATLASHQDSTGGVIAVPGQDVRLVASAAVKAVLSTELQLIVLLVMPDETTRCQDATGCVPRVAITAQLGRIVSGDV